MTNVVASAVVGSTAYGLAREGSDVDQLGVFVAPTLELAGLDWNPKKDSIVRTNPDITLHEVGKFLRLALKGNPTILELFWVEQFSFIKMDGAHIMRLAKAVLSEKAVRNAYLGYATAQVKKLESRGDSFSSDTRKRTAKHARHIYRLLTQAQQLATTGELTLRVEHPEDYWAFDEMDVPVMLGIFDHEFEITAEAFNCSVLPAHPDIDRVTKTLRDIRAKNLYG